MDNNKVIRLAVPELFFPQTIELDRAILSLLGSKNFWTYYVPNDNAVTWT